METIPAVVTDRTLSERLVTQFMAIDEVPDDVINIVLTRMIDTLGAAHSAAAIGEGVAAGRALADNGSGRATFWASGGRRGEPAFAALANGSLCHAMDFDDTHTGAVMHPSGVVLSTALAVGEQVGATGRQVLAAATIGYEAAIRLGLGAPGAFQPRGVQGSAILGPFAAALVAGKLTGASPQVVTNAWGIAGSMASGINEFHADGSQAKQIHLGWAAHSGILAIKLARAGGTGPRSVLEGRDGIYRIFGGTDQIDDAIEDGIGTDYLVGDVATKPYPACHCIHPVIDAWVTLTAEEKIDANEIARVTCLVPEWYVGIILEPRAVKMKPPTSYAARFSLPYALARVILDGSLGPESFDLSAPSDSRVDRLMNLVDYEIVDFAEFPQYFPGGVRVHLTDGTTREATIRHNRGSDCSPMTLNEISRKLREAAGQIGTETAYDGLMTAIYGLPTAPSLDQLATALAAFDSPHLSR